MSKGIRFTDEFKKDAVAQVVERGYAPAEKSIGPAQAVLMAGCSSAEAGMVSL